MTLLVTQLNGDPDALDECESWRMTLDDLRALPPRSWDEDTDGFEDLEVGEVVRFGRRWKVERLPDEVAS